MRWLTVGGTAAALAIGGATVWGVGWRGLGLLLAFFVSGSVLTQLAGGAGGRRTAAQVFANGGVAAGAALLGWWPVFAGALTAAAADTWATEIGAFSPTSPRLITSGAPVPHGASGGITALGTVGGVVGATAMSWLAVGLEGPRAGVLTLAAAGVVGMFVDSVLGATAQGVFECPACGARSEQRGAVCHEPVRLIRGWPWLDNDVVNVGATLTGAGVAAVGWQLCC